MTVDWDRLDHDRLEEAVAAYLLDALEDDERAQVAAHIEGCPSCRALIWRLSHAVDSLPAAVDDVRPPARLRERILSAAAVTPAARADARPAAPRIIPFPRRASPTRQTRTFEADLVRVRPSRLRVVAYGAAGAVLVAGFGVLSGVVVSLNNQVHHAQQVAQRAQAAPAEYLIKGSGSMAGASGTMTTVPGQALSVLAFTGLPQVDGSKVYQIWEIDPNPAVKATSLGVFTPDPNGSYTLKLNQTLPAGTTIAVTQENGPQGAPQPTQKPELAGTIPH